MCEMQNAKLPSRAVSFFSCSNLFDTGFTTVGFSYSKNCRDREY